MKLANEGKNSVDPHQVNAIIAAAFCDYRKEHPENGIDPEEAKTMGCIIQHLLLLGNYSFALAQSGGSSGAAGPTGSSSGNTLSNGSTINGTGGSPGPNTGNALTHGGAGNNLGETNPNTLGSSSGPSYTSKTANDAVTTMGNTNTGILKK